MFVGIVIGGVFREIYFALLWIAESRMFPLVTIETESNQGRYRADKYEQLKRQCHARLLSTSMPASSNPIPDEDNL